MGIYVKNNNVNRNISSIDMGGGDIKLINSIKTKYDGDIREVYSKSKSTTYALTDLRECIDSKYMELYRYNIRDYGIYIQDTKITTVINDLYIMNYNEIENGCIQFVNGFTVNFNRHLLPPSIQNDFMIIGNNVKILFRPNLSFMLAINIDNDPVHRLDYDIANMINMPESYGAMAVFPNTRLNDLRRHYISDEIYEFNNSYYFNESSFRVFDQTNQQNNDYLLSKHYDITDEKFENLKQGSCEFFDPIKFISHIRDNAGQYPYISIETDNSKRYFLSNPTFNAGLGSELFGLSFITKIIFKLKPTGYIQGRPRYDYPALTNTNPSVINNHFWYSQTYKPEITFIR